MHLKKVHDYTSNILHCKDNSTDSQVSQLLHLDLHSVIPQLFCTEDTCTHVRSLGRRFHNWHRIWFEGLFLMAGGVKWWWQTRCYSMNPDIDWVSQSLTCDWTCDLSRLWTQQGWMPRETLKPEERFLGPKNAKEKCLNWIVSILSFPKHLPIFAWTNGDWPSAAFCQSWCRTRRPPRQPQPTEKLDSRRAAASTLSWGQQHSLLCASAGRTTYTGKRKREAKFRTFKMARASLQRATLTRFSCLVWVACRRTRWGWPGRTGMEVPVSQVSA